MHSVGRNWRRLTFIESTYLSYRIKIWVMLTACQFKTSASDRNRTWTKLQAIGTGGEQCLRESTLFDIHISFHFCFPCLAPNLQFAFHGLLGFCLFACPSESDLLCCFVISPCTKDCDEKNSFWLLSEHFIVWQSFWHPEYWHLDKDLSLGSLPQVPTLIFWDFF